MGVPMCHPQKDVMWTCNSIYEPRNPTSANRVGLHHSENVPVQILAVRQPPDTRNRHLRDTQAPPFASTAASDSSRLVTVMVSTQGCTGSRRGSRPPLIPGSLGSPVEMSP